MQLNRLYNAKLHVFKSSGEWTCNSDNENIYHPKLAWYAERSSLTDINPKSYDLIAFEQVNLLLYFYFYSFECRFFLKDLKSTLPSSVALWFRNLANNLSEKHCLIKKSLWNSKDQRRARKYKRTIRKQIQTNILMNIIIMMLEPSLSTAVCIPWLVFQEKKTDPKNYINRFIYV